MTSQLPRDDGSGLTYRAGRQWHSAGPAMTAWSVVAMLLAAAVSVAVPATVIDHFLGS